MHQPHNQDEPIRRALLPAFAELRPSLDNGDVLLFGGDSPLCERLKRLTRCRWSHVALIARAPATNRLLLLEATGSTELCDVTTCLMSPGVQLYDLEEWIVHYGGETAIRRLEVQRTPEMLAALLGFYQEVHGRPYEHCRLEMFRSGYDGPLGRNREEDLSSLFCSELVAAAYQRMGLLPLQPPANEYTPRDFSSAARCPLPLLGGASLGEEVLVCS